MMRATHFTRLFQTGNQTVRGQPDQETDCQNPQQPGDKAPIALRTGNTFHAEPEIVVRPQKQGANEDRLQDKEPGEDAAHHGNTQLLVIPVDLPAEPVASKGQWDQPDDGNKIAD